MNGSTENKLHIDFNLGNPAHSLAQLKELGNEQGFLTYDDILRLFPEADHDVDFLDQIFVTIQNAGISFIEADKLIDASIQEASGKDASVKDVSAKDVPSQEPEEENGVFDLSSTLKEDNLLSSLEPDNLVGLYFCDAGRSPLLTFEQEVELAKRIERGTLAREEIVSLKMSSGEQHKALQRVIDDSWAAVDQLITANSRLVISIAKKYTHRGVPFLDLIQEGNVGLMRAVKRFDYKRGYKFSTYATWWIRQAVSRALADQGRTIRLPVYKSDQMTKMFRQKHQLRQLLGRDPAVAELAEAMDVTPQTIQQLYKHAQFPLSLDMPTSFDGDSVLGDFIEDQESPDPDEVTTISLLGQHLAQALEMLPPREALILKLRFGLSNGEAHTLREVGVKIGVSRERIRQIEAQAMRRLRQPEIKYKLRSYIRQLHV